MILKYKCVGLCLAIAASPLFFAFPRSRAIAAALPTVPEPPRVLLDTSYAAPTGNTINVRMGGNFQQALDQAAAGDEIVLEAGASFSGNFVLSGKAGSGWITIRTSNLAGISIAGTRVSPQDAPAMARLITPNASPVLVAMPKTSSSIEAHHYRFVGIEFTSAGNITNLLKLGETGTLQTSFDQVPHDLILDRCYIHGGPLSTLRRGVALNSARTSIIDSYISDCHEVGADSQAIAGWNGPGPFKIVNNYLEGAGENVLFGGADPNIPNLIPSDIEFRRNFCAKPLTWKTTDPSYLGTEWSVKNLFELKNAQRVLISGNVFENVWLQSQTGYAVLFKSVNQDGTAPWSVSRDIDFRDNVVRHCGGAVNIQGRAYDQPGGQTSRVSIRNNLFYDVSASMWQGDGAFLKITEAADVLVDHNTVLQTGNIITAYGLPTSRFSFTNNITPNNLYGVKGDGTACGSGTLNAYFTDVLFQKNALPGGVSTDYPANNFFPASISGVGFVDMSNLNYGLSSFSPYKSAGSDGLDLGANIDEIAAASSDSSTSLKPPPPPPAPPSKAPVPAEIVLYASEATVVGGAWFVTSDSSAAGGARLANPESGGKKLVDAKAAPASYFEMTFTANAATPYRLWMRGKAKKDSPYNDSVHVQFSGSVDAAGMPVFRIGTTSATQMNLEDCLGCGLAGWGWQDNGWGQNVLGPLVYFASTGPQTIRVQVREDGLSIDQIVLSPNTYINGSPGLLKRDTTILPR